MSLKIDKQGRVTIPSPLRDRLGLEPLSSLLVEAVGDGLLVRPAVERMEQEENTPFLAEEVVREDTLRPVERAEIFKRLSV